MLSIASAISPERDLLHGPFPIWSVPVYGLASKRTKLGWPYAAGSGLLPSREPTGFLTKGDQSWIVCSTEPVANILCARDQSQHCMPRECTGSKALPA